MAISDKLIRKPSPMTARELLVEVAGKDHALHSVVAKLADAPKGRLTFRCSCGTLCYALASEENVLALQNVPIEQPGAKKTTTGRG